MSDVITDPKMRTFVNSSVSTDFGLSISQVANKVKGYGRFHSWLGGDVNKIEQVLQIVKDNGISPAFFGAYEKTEGYNSKWGWLNHTTQKGDYFQDAHSVSNVVKTASNNMSSKPSWIDYGNPVDFVPTSVKTAGNEHFSNLPKGTIGRALIPLTAAAAWEVYYPNGLLKEYNQIQNYGAPINNMINTIEEWGGVIGGNGGGTDPVDPDPEIPVDPDPEDPDVPVDKIFNILLHEKSEDVIGNRFFNIEKIYENMFKLKPTKLFYDTVIIEGIEDYPYDEEVDPIDPIVPDPVDPEDPDPVEPSGDFFFPTKLGGGINFWNPPYTEPSKQLKEDMDYGGGRAGGRIHSGYDIGGGGTSHPIYAVRDGKVTHVENRGTAGFVIAIDHSTDGYHSLYMHLLPNSNRVSVGDTVRAGQHIATMGSSGGNYSIHLHIEISPTGVFHNFESTINPREYLKVTGNNRTELKIPS